MPAEALKNLIDNFVLLSRDPRSGVAGILGVLQLNVCVKRFIQPFIGFWLLYQCPFHADDFMALRAPAEEMTCICG